MDIQGGLTGDSQWDSFMNDNNDIEKAIRSMSRPTNDYKAVFDDFNAREGEPNYEQVNRMSKP